MADNSSCTSSRNKKSKTKKKKLIDHRTLRVSNLPSNVTIHTLSDYFSDCSIPVRLYLHDDKSAGFVEFPNERDAAEALISAANKYPFLRIIYATKTKLKPYSLTSTYRYPKRLVAMVPPNHIIQRQNGQGPRTAAEERRIIQQALEIVFEQRLGEYGNCERCKARTTKKCSNCGTFYCSKDCQLIDWNIHQHFCSDGADGETLPTPRSISDQVGKTPLHGSEAPQNVNGLRQVSYRSVKSVEVSRRITNGQSEGPSERPRITDSESVAGRRDDFRRSRTPQDDDKPFRPFKRNFDSDKKTDRDDAGSSRKFSSNKSETGSARVKGRDDRRDRDRDRDRPKRFEKKFDDVKKEETWADSPASPPPEDKENLEPNFNVSKPAELPRDANERKQPELPRKDRCSSVEKEEVKTPIKKEKNQTAVLSVSPIRKEVFGLVRESPDSFWVLNANQIDEWQALTIRLQELCESGTKAKPRMGLICGCFFEDMWYRAKIIALEPKIRVHYIDFGNTSEYEDDLIKLPEDVTSQDGMAFLIKFAKGTPKNYEEQSLDGITFPVEVVKETKEYSVIKFVGEKYPDDDDVADDKEETLEVPKKKEKIPEPEVKDERKSDSSRRDERRREVERKPAETPEMKRDTGRRSESPEGKIRDTGRKSVGSPERRRDKERRSESPERKRQIERKFQSPERETEPEKRPAAPARNALAMSSVKKATPKKDNNRENVFDCLNKGDTGCCFIVSKSGSSLFGCIVPNSNGDKYAEYFEQLGNIPLPKRTYPAEVGDSVLAISAKGYESRGVVMEKEDETYLVNLVDYAATVKVDSVYEMPKDLREFTELGVEVVIQEQLKKNFVYPDEDTIFLFTITGNFDGEKFPCLLTLQEDDTETQIAKAFIKKWAPEQSASGPLKSGTTVVISCLVSFRKVWVRLSGEAAEAELREISDKLEEHAKSAERYKKPPKVGELCCVKFIEDGDYYRAVVESVDESMVIVRFIDYGNEQEGKFSELLRLSEEFKSIPPFAYEIELIGAPDTSKDKKLATYYMKLLNTACDLILTYEGDIKDGVILTEKETGTVVNDVAKEKMTQMKK